MALGARGRVRNALSPHALGAHARFFRAHLFLDSFCYRALWPLRTMSVMQNAESRSGAGEQEKKEDKKPFALGPLIPARVAWVIMESPAPIGCLIWWLLRDPHADTNWMNWTLFVLFEIHYIHRAFIFPLRMRAGSPMPLNIMFMAWFFCLLNGYLQGRAIAHFNVYDTNEIYSLHTIIGVPLFFWGLFVNIQSDSILLNLRKPGEVKKYRIPTGGMFKYVSAANYFGEIVEWTGFALAAWSLPSTAFALFTFSNIGPRGLSNHADLKRRFKGSYPPERAALIPFIW
eukprot:TRINITY_DN1675_c0_g1_i9.p1 TRINITY_DN1675_c0_g1~~TRINITY_DN1675_c0_g1_i9.p1  ORF type:complete len:287 (+),score=30.78 TRINITY_DN1675_c0_g1_i9:62-922(+)